MPRAIYHYVLRLHRWLALAFALPLLAVIATGLVLSFEPIAQQVRADRPITLSDITTHIVRFDPEGRARNLSIRTYDYTMTIGGVGSAGSIVVDLNTGEEARQLDQRRPNAIDAETVARSLFGVGLSDIFLIARRMHETLLLELGGIVVASTFVMLLLGILGIAMGWPQFRHSIRGWHQGVAWVTLPLLILSPLTALGMAYGVTFSAGGAPGSGGSRVSMLDAVKLVAANHDVADLTSIRQRGGRLMARIYVGGELRGFAIGPNSLEPLQRNWPRLVHEGNWGWALGSLLNVVTSLALLLLIVTGVTLWIRRTRRRMLRTAPREIRSGQPSAANSGALKVAANSDSPTA
jgi:uncharacterized iron-regulated membrane protein